MTETNYINDGFKLINSDGQEEIIQIPYNLNNVLVKEQDIIQILSKMNVNIEKVNHINFFIEAFTHKSYCKKDIFPQDVLIASKNELGNPVELLELRDRSYERLEYFGDRVVKLIVSMYLFYRYPNEDEGFMTRLQTKIEDKSNLSVMSKEIGLGKFFLISRQIEQMNGRNLEKIHEDVFEAFMGALYLSNGLEPCLLLLVNLLESLIDYSEKLYQDNNYKDRLLRHFHAQKWNFPVYETIHFEGPAHKRKYIMGVEKPNVQPYDKKNNRYIGYGIGNSKKEGEQAAAKMALIVYGILNKDQYVKSDLYYPPWDLIEKYNGETPILFNETIQNEDDIIKQINDSIGNTIKNIVDKKYDFNENNEEKTKDIIHDDIDDDINDDINDDIDDDKSSVYSQMSEKSLKM